MRIKKKSGIYEIHSKSSGKAYIGSALNLNDRWSEHLHNLRNGKHNLALQNAYNKYSESDFEFNILEEIADPHDLVEREQYWINLKKSSDSAFGYNIRSQASSNVGMRHSDETKQRISDSLKSSEKNIKRELKIGFLPSPL